MEDVRKTAEVLNDLIKINNDRIAGYQKAINELPVADVDLKALISTQKTELLASHDHVKQLRDRERAS